MKDKSTSNNLYLPSILFEIGAKQRSQCGISVSINYVLLGSDFEQYMGKLNVSLEMLPFILDLYFVILSFL